MKKNLRTILAGVAALTLFVSLAPSIAAAGDYAKKEAKQAKADIVDTAVAAGNFSTLVAAVKAAGLVETLRGEGPFTVFAPTDEAFAALPEGTVADLLKPENKEKLIAILTYHVVAGEVPSDVAVTLEEGKTVNGQSFSVHYDGKVLKIDDAKVVKADIRASNGVIHVIDKVLIPGATTGR